MSMSRSALLPYMVLLAGVLVASASSILTRYAQNEGMPSLVIAVWRLGLAALLLAPIAWVHVGTELRSLQRRDVALCLVAGLLLALHFAVWISSLVYTSVASSTALVTTNPIWVGLASWLIFRERPGWGTVTGIVLSLSGSGCIILSGLDEITMHQYTNPFLGNILALGGALTVSAYLLVGRGLRHRISILAYIWLVYTSGAVILLAWVLLAQYPLLGFSMLAYLYVIGLAVGPQLLSHTAFNWALAYVSATFVAVSVLGEPIGAAMLAWFLFGESFVPLQLVGFALLIAGISVAATSENSVSTEPGR